MTELLARVRAHLRRTTAATSTALAFPELTIDLERRRVVQGGREVRLTPTEFSLLEVLATNAGKPMFIEQIIARVWRSAPSTSADTVRVHMSSLRKKIEPNPPSRATSSPSRGSAIDSSPNRFERQKAEGRKQKTRNDILQESRTARSHSGFWFLVSGFCLLPSAFRTPSFESLNPLLSASDGNVSLLLSRVRRPA